MSEELSLVGGVLLAVITAGSIALSIFLVKKVANTIRCKYNKHKIHNKQVTDLPALFERHRSEHLAIKEQLDLAEMADQEMRKELELAKQHRIVSMRQQILSIHDRAIDQGCISPYWATQFYDLVKIYEIDGGNSFVDKLKVDIDTMRINDLDIK